MAHQEPEEPHEQARLLEVGDDELRAREDLQARSGSGVIVGRVVDLAYAALEPQ